MATAWAHTSTVVLAAFLASLVEFVEALTIVLAVGTVRGWRSALTGTAAAVVVLTLLVALFGPALGRVPIARVQFVVGVLLLLFGLRWLRKAVLRAAGVLALRDEAAAFARATKTLASADGTPGGALDPLAVATAFKAVTLEGLEVVFIVIAAGAGGRVVPASVGAAAAGALVVMAGVVLHRPLATVPENALKLGVGVLLSAFGVFWIGEGLGFPWPGEDLALPALVAGVSLAAWTAWGAARARRRRARAGAA